MPNKKINASEAPKVSVIVPVYKVEFYLARCLSSICNQTLKDIEIIIVDEGLMDQDRVITEEFMANDVRISAIHKGGGYGVCVNAGIEAARGEYIGIIESDDFIEPYMYEKLYEQAKSIDADIVKSPFFQYYDDENDELAPMMDELVYQLPTDRAFALEQYPILLSTHPSIWAGIYKTDWLRESGIRFHDKGAYLDIVFRFRTLKSAKRIGWIQDPTYHWRFTNPTSTNAEWNLNAAIARWEEVLTSIGKGSEELKKYEAYLLPEAYLNIFIHFDIFKCTGDQKKRIIELRSYFSDEAVNKCVYIDRRARIDFMNGKLTTLSIKRYANALFLGLSNDEHRKNIIITWLSLVIVAVMAKIFGTESGAGILSVLWIATVIVTIVYGCELLLMLALRWCKKLLHLKRNMK